MRCLSSLPAALAEAAPGEAPSSVRMRNFAVVAHVDHGKTTLMDKLMREAAAADVGSGAPGEAAPAERALDSMALERERGITSAW